VVRRLPTPFIYSDQGPFPRCPAQIMAGFMKKQLVLPTLLLVQLGTATVLTNNQNEHHESVTIGTNGGLVRREAASAFPVQQKDLAARDLLSKRTSFKNVKEHRSDLCNDNYVQGKPNTADCSAPGKDGSARKAIEEPTMCMEAAREECADDSCLGSPFVIDSCYFDYYPKRCFLTEAGKWFFNPSGFTPTKLMGTPTCPGQTGAVGKASPVCVQVEYINGTTSSAGATECPTGFEVIMHEDTCRTAATCLAYCPEEQFRVLNVTHPGQAADATEGAPLGCHINPADGCARFNTLPVTAGQTITGIPICNLTLARGSEHTDVVASFTATTGTDATPTATTGTDSTPTATTDTTPAGSLF